MTEFRKLVNNIIDDYCSEFNVKQDDLKQRIHKVGRRKVKNGVHISAMRMCLGHYFDITFNLKLIQIAELVGYSDHSVLSGNRKRIKWYLETNDTFFLMHYLPLLQIADKYEDAISPYRKCKSIRTYEQI